MHEMQPQIRMIGKLKEIAENDSWFNDNPDVVEVDELI